MKRTLLFAISFVAMAMVSRAETDITALSLNESDATEFSDINTDQAFLEQHKPFMAPPSEARPHDEVGYWAQKVASRLKVTGYAQAGYNATLNEGANNTNSFEMRRVILMVGADIAPHFYAFFMHDFKSGNMQEYYMEYRPCKAFNVRLGQSKREFTLENPISPTVLESIGPMAQSVFWLNGADPLMSNGSGRDMGLMFYGDVLNGRLRYVAEVVNGGQINTSDKNNQKNFIGKLEYKLMPNLRVGVSGELGHGYSVAYSAYNPDLYDNENKKGMTYRQNRWAFSGEWKSKKTGTDYFRHRCASVRAEVMGGMDGDVHSFGGYISSAIPVYKQLDVVAMVDNFNYNTGKNYLQNNFMIGLQLWLHTKCRLQLQYTYSALSSAHRADLGKTNCSKIDAQVQVAF